MQMNTYKRTFFTEGSETSVFKMNPDKILERQGIWAVYKGHFSLSFLVLYLYTLNVSLEFF